MRRPLTNKDLAFNVLSELHRLGTKHLVLCPGGRNAPLTELLSLKDHPFTLHNHFDERAASFYALGLTQSENAPVAIITTSGTAVSETLSACIEAHYSRTPLIVVSADRPQSYRGSGAPQAIRQVELLKSYCAQVYDLQNELLAIHRWDRRSPMHINVCFDEPLLNADDSSVLAYSSQEKSFEEVKETNFNSDPSGIFRFFNQVKKPLIIVSGSFGFDKEIVRESLTGVRLPIFFESTSGLKSNPSFRNVEIEFPELLTASGKVDGIIRIGHVPTHRAWRDLEVLKLPVLNFSHNPFTGLSWEEKVFNLNLLKEISLSALHHPDLKSLMDSDLAQRERREKNLSRFPFSEPSLIKSLQSFWNPDKLVYLGNSLPIREWDYVCSTSFSKVVASRGANGIDGQISTFMGQAFNEYESLGVFGDLTSLYDMSGPWLLKYMKGINYITVVNNAGGMIFDRMFNKDIYLNKHELSFEPLARFWDLDHLHFKPSENPFQKGPSLIEIKPDGEQTRAFWEAMK